MIEDDVEEFLEHFGVKGMKWGVRRERTPGVSRATDRDARKDAAESARAKMFYGEGAGNRRKLIKATVDAKKKRDPGYAKAFDKHLADQDLSTHASKAKKERSRTDRNTKTKQRAGYLARRLTGEMGTQAAFVAAGVAGAAFLNSPRGRSAMNRTMSQARSAVNNQRAKSTTDSLVDYFSRNS